MEDSLNLRPVEFFDIDCHFITFLCRSVTSEDVILSNSSIDWITGLLYTILTCASSCKLVVTNRPYTPEYFVELVQKYKITHVGAAPHHPVSLVACPTATAENLSTIRSFTITGGSVSLPIIQRLQGILKNSLISFGYGLTEIGGISFNFGYECRTSMGKLVPGLQARIVDEQGKNLPPNEVGEIYTKTEYRPLQ